MPACRAKRVSCIKIEDVHSTKSANMVMVRALGPISSIPLELEADTGANITVMKADVLQEMDWVKLQPTDVHIRGYSGIAEPCLGKATINLKMGLRSHEEEVFSVTGRLRTFYHARPAKHLEIFRKGFQMSS